MRKRRVAPSPPPLAAREGVTVDPARAIALRAIALGRGLRRESRVWTPERDRGRMSRRTGTIGVATACALVVSVGVAWTGVGVDARARLEIVNAAHDIAHVSHILCGSGDRGKQKCQDYAEMLTPHADDARMLDHAFAALARRYSECPTGSDGGDLGYFPRGEMAKDFENVVFDSKTPEETVVGPVETRNGWHVMLIHHRHLADEEAKERARQKAEEMREERMQRAEAQKKYQEERAKRKAERASRRHQRDDERHSLHADEYHHDLSDRLHEHLRSLHEEL